VIGIVVGLVLILLSAAGFVIASILDWNIALPRPPGLWRRQLERERETATSLGWPMQRWVMLRTVTLVGGVALGVASHVLYMLVLLTLVGLTLVPFATARTAESRRIATARAFLAYLSEVRESLLASSVEFDSVIRKAAAAAPRELESLLTPVAQARGDVFLVFTEQIANARSALLERCYTVLVANRTRNRTMLAQLIADESEIIDIELDIEDQVRAERAESRGVIMLMGCVLLGMFALLNSQAGLHQYFASTGGQVALLISTCIFAASCAAASIILSQPPAPRWDVRTMYTDMARSGRG